LDQGGGGGPENNGKKKGREETSAEKSGMTPTLPMRGGKKNRFPIHEKAKEDRLEGGAIGRKNLTGKGGQKMSEGNDPHLE